MRPDSPKKLAGEKEESLVVSVGSFRPEDDHLGLLGFYEIDDLKELGRPVGEHLIGVAVKENIGEDKKGHPASSFERINHNKFLGYNDSV